MAWARDHAMRMRGMGMGRIRMRNWRSKRDALHELVDTGYAMSSSTHLRLACPLASLLAVRKEATFGG